MHAAAERTHAQQWSLSSASSARLPARIANPPRLSEPPRVSNPPRLKDPPRRTAAPPSAPSATSTPSGGFPGDSAPAPRPLTAQSAAERGVRAVYEALSARERRKLRAALFPLRARAAESASAVWQESWGVVARLVAAELHSHSTFSPPPFSSHLSPRTSPHLSPPTTLPPSPHPTLLPTSAPHHPPAAPSEPNPFPSPPPNHRPSPRLPSPHPSLPPPFQGEPDTGEEQGGRRAGGRRGAGCDAEAQGVGERGRKEARRLRMEEQKQVLTVVEVLSEGVVRAGRGAVAAGEVEELVWAAFVKSHEAVLTPEHWTSFVPLLLKLVRLALVW
ncbi:unnamed protein product [Closterium sp. NIES-64]|nr:unnamed protein product [Closterium sp. NIES-64]